MPHDRSSRPPPPAAGARPGGDRRQLLRGAALGLVARCAAAAPLTATARVAAALATTMLLAGSPAPAAAQAGAPLATVTILDGPASVLRGAQRLQLVEGVRLQPLDIVETAAETRLARLEFADGSALGLGPATRVLVDPRFTGERGRGAARAYLLRGWVKWNAAPGGAKPAAGAVPPLASPALDLTGATAGVVVALEDGAVRAFVESGEATVQERDAGSAVGSVRTLRNGEFFARIGAAKSAVTPRPAPDFIQRVPRPFLDTLPSRAALFKDKDVAAKPAGDLVYADARDWLTGEASLRRALMNRWRPLTRNPAFRDAMAANMAAHPEWDRVLFPEKYLPKPASAATPGASKPYVR